MQQTDRGGLAYIAIRPCYSVAVFFFPPLEVETIGVKLMQ